MHIAVLLNGDHSDVIGILSVTQKLKEALLNGVQFTVSCGDIVQVFGEQKISFVNFSFVPVEDKK